MRHEVAAAFIDASLHATEEGSNRAVPDWVPRLGEASLASHWSILRGQKAHRSVPRTSRGPATNQANLLARMMLPPEGKMILFSSPHPAAASHAACWAKVWEAPAG